MCTHTRVSCRCVRLFQSLFNELRSKGRADHDGQIRTRQIQKSFQRDSHCFFFYFYFHPQHFQPILSSFLYPSCVLIPSSSLLPSLSPGHYSVLPLYERLLFKTVRSDLVPTEAIPLAALCIYHGSPILSRLLTLQFSLPPPPPPVFLLSPYVTLTSHTSPAFFCSSRFFLKPCKTRCHFLQNNLDRFLFMTWLRISSVC